MSIGHRVFVVEEDAVFPISQKTFTELYSGKVGALPKFAGQTVQIAVVIYTVQQRKPKTIIQIDCERIRILGDGTIDERSAVAEYMGQIVTNGTENCLANYLRLSQKYLSELLTKPS